MFSLRVFLNCFAKLRTFTNMHVFLPSFLLLLCLGKAPSTKETLLYPIFLIIYKASWDFRIQAMRKERLVGKHCPLDQSRYFKPRIKYTHFFHEVCLVLPQTKFATTFMLEPLRDEVILGPSVTCNVIVQCCKLNLAVVGFL